MDMLPLDDSEPAQGASGGATDAPPTEPPPASEVPAAEPDPVPPFDPLSVRDLKQLAGTRTAAEFVVP